MDSDYYWYEGDLSELGRDFNVTLSPLLFNELTTKGLPMNPCISLDMVRPHVDLKNYEKFSFAVNGIVTSVLMAFGLLGNLLLFSQVEKRRILKHRLGAHLRMLCVWDALLLVTSFASSAVMSLLYGTMRYYGLAAYLLYICNPLGNFSVSGTLWQIVAITVERYLAVSRPLSERMRDARLSVRAICLSIVGLAALLNLPTFVLEHNVDRCMIVDGRGIEMPGNQSRSWQIVKTDIAKTSDIYKLVCHFIPDLIFRCPFPFILVALLTGRTLQLAHKRSIVRTPRRRDGQYVTIILTVLNVKFIICNSLFMVNTVMDLIQVDASDYWAFFLAALYMTDVSNLLLVLHSATNWLLFYEWPFKRKKRSYRSTQITVLDPSDIELLSEMWNRHKPDELGAGLLTAMCRANQSLTKHFNTPLPTRNNLVTNGVCGYDADVTSPLLANGCSKSEVSRMGCTIGEFLTQVVSELQTKGLDCSDVRDELRRVGSVHQARNVSLYAKDWISAKQYLLSTLLCGEYKHSLKAQRAVEVFLSFVLYELKSGFLCESVRRSNNHYLFPKYNSLCTRLNATLEESSPETARLSLPNTPKQSNIIAYVTTV